MSVKNPYSVALACACLLLLAGCNGGTDPMDDVRRARDGVQETLEVVRRRLDRA